MEERRGLRRWQLLYYLRIFDYETDSFLGHVCDISEQGLRIISEWPIPTAKRYQLWMEMPRAAGGRQRLAFQAESLWTRPDTDPTFHSTGFRLLELEPRIAQQISALIEELQAGSAAD